MKNAQMFVLGAFLATNAAAQELGDAWGTANAEAAHYRIVELPIPRELALECGSLAALPDGKLAIGTRRGEILIVDGAFEPLPRPVISTFAAGLDEVLGLGYRHTVTGYHNHVGSSLEHIVSIFHTDRLDLAFNFSGLITD